MRMAGEGPENADGSNKARNIILGIAGAPALAIAGSALWDFLFKPLFLWLGETIVAVTNLGSTALSNSMYGETAKGNYERARVFILAGLGGAIMALTTRILSSRSRLDGRPQTFDGFCDRW